MATKKKHAKKKDAIAIAQPVPVVQQATEVSLEDRLAKLKGALDKVANMAPLSVPISELNEYGVKTVTIVARNVATMNNGVDGRYQMETGRMAAQAGHAVSKLKLSYALWKTQSDTSKTYDFVRRLYKNSITNIILEARDEKELAHILRLCRDQGIHAVKFFDTNIDLYGRGVETFTAIAIGPVYKEWVEGITDYLPLFDEKGK